MAIAKAAILIFVNAQLHRSETDIDVQIQTVLNDLSNFDFLTAEDTTQSLAAGDTYLAYPTGFKALETIVLNDGSYDGAPLIPLPGGFKEYKQLMEDFNSGLRSEPEWYAEYEKRFYIYPTPGAAYTVVIKYCKFHPQSVASIEFGDEFKNAIYFGSAFEVACKFGNTNYISIWGPRYGAEKEMRRISAPAQPRIVEG